MRALFLCCIVLSAPLALTLSGTARADAAPPLSASAATERFDQGIGAMEKGDFATAVKAFGEAYDATKNARYLWNLALAEVKADRPAEALAHIRVYLKRSDASPQNIERGNLLVERLHRDVGLLHIVAPAGADVVVDGTTVGKAPLGAPIEVDPDRAHVVEARSVGASAEEKLKPAGAMTVEVKLAFPEQTVTSPLNVPPSSTPSPAASRAPVVSEAADRGGLRHEGLLYTLVVTEIAGAAACGGIGYAVFAEGNNSNDSSKQLVGGTLMGAGVLFFAADILTLVLWPHGEERSDLGSFGVLRAYARPRLWRCLPARSVLVSDQRDPSQRVGDVASAASPAATEGSAGDFSPGDTIPGTGYRVRRFLGEGGHASAYECENRIGKRVAVKVLHRHLAAQDPISPSAWPKRRDGPSGFATRTSSRCTTRG